jgi:prepilin signal peptidase PulO-like enzyme (type II secretory pathway)
MLIMLWLAEHYWSVVGLMLGGSFASFACVVVERGRSGESINGRSHCVCGHQLRVWENIPVIGWLSSAGKARCCGARIPAHYLYAEITGMLAWWLCGFWALPGLLFALLLTGVVTFAARVKFQSRK